MHLGPTHSTESLSANCRSCWPKGLSAHHLKRTRSPHALSLVSTKAPQETAGERRGQQSLSSPEVDPAPPTVPLRRFKLLGTKATWPNPPSAPQVRSLLGRARGGALKSQLCGKEEPSSRTCRTTGVEGRAPAQEGSAPDQYRTEGGLSTCWGESIQGLSSKPARMQCRPRVGRSEVAGPQDRGGILQQAQTSGGDLSPLPSLGTAPTHVTLLRGVCGMSWMLVGASAPDKWDGSQESSGPNRVLCQDHQTGTGHRDLSLLGQGPCVPSHPGERKQSHLGGQREAGAQLERG